FERMRACAGSLFGILLVGLTSYALLPHEARTIWLIAPMGASTVLLFAVPSSPLAQPWSILGGNLCAALIGVSCAKLV
ncbi:HPP family protein, partial [Salmonella enterica]|uniref:HPP family protein n=1 Tax=Salmonella enterica TaxID=28901 RepID=UPI003CECCC00